MTPAPSPRRVRRRLHRVHPGGVRPVGEQDDPGRGGSVAASLSRALTAPSECCWPRRSRCPAPPVAALDEPRPIPSSRASRSVPGGTRTAALPANATSPTLNSSGSPSTNRRAACLAAASRSGSTSVASIEVDTSTATTTVARSRGTRTSAVGRAKPTTSSASMARNSPAGTCRRHPGRSGATRSSSGRFVKRTAYRCSAAHHQQLGDDQGEHAEQQPEPHGDRKIIAVPPGAPAARRGEPAPGVHEAGRGPHPVPVGRAARGAAAPDAADGLGDRPRWCGRRPRRTVRGVRGREVQTSRRRPVSGSTSTTGPRPAAPARAGRSPRPRARRGGRPAGAGPPPRRTAARTVRRARRSRRPPPAPRPRGAGVEQGVTTSPGGPDWRRRAARSRRRGRWPRGRQHRPDGQHVRWPDGPGPRRTPSPPSAGTPEPVAGAVGEQADRRRPPRRPGRAFSTLAVPKSMLASASTRTQVSSSRSARVRQTCGSQRAGGDVPVDPAHVVLARAGSAPTSSGLGARPEPQARGARRAAGPSSRRLHGQLERGERLLGTRRATSGSEARVRPAR